MAARGVNSYREFTQLYVRHWDTWNTEGRLSHLFVLPLKQAKSNGDSEEAFVWEVIGAPKDIMYSMIYNSPTPPFGGVEQLSIAPNGLTIAFTCEAVRYDTAWTTGWDVYLVSLAPSSLAPTTPRSLTDKTQARCQDPVFSADGGSLFYTAMDKPQSESDRLHLVYTPNPHDITMIARITLITVMY